MLASSRRRAQIGNGAGVDGVGGGDDAAGCCLAEHLREPRHRHRAAVDHISQHLAGPHRRQLVDIAHQQQGGIRREGVQQGGHQGHIHHRGLIHHQQVGLQRQLGVAPEPVGSGVELQQPVDGLGLQPGGLTHPLGGPAGGGAEQDAQLLGRQDAQDGVDQGGFAHPGPAGDHQHLAGQSLLHSCFLTGGQLQGETLLHPGDGPGQIDRFPGRAACRQRLQGLGDAALIAVEVGEEDRRLSGQGVGHHRALGELHVQGAPDQPRLQGHPAGWRRFHLARCSTASSSPASWSSSAVGRPQWPSPLASSRA